MDRDHLSKIYEEQLEELEKDYESVKSQLRGEQDGPTRNRLERQIKEIGRQMREKQQQLRNHRNQLEQEAAGEAVQSLNVLLTNHTAELEIVLRTYQQTRFHWGVPIRADVKTAEDVIKELGRIPAGRRSYTAQDEFVARLVHDVQAPELVEGLKIWGGQYRPHLNCLELCRQIEAETEQSRQNIQPAILIKITLSDEASTQAQDDQDYYELTAWLIEDIEIYKTQRTGYHALIVTGSPDAEPCTIDDLLIKVPSFLSQFTEARNKLCANTTHFPEIHISLPLELMHLDTDRWCFEVVQGRRPQRLGDDHIVVVRCGERYERNYTQRPAWLKYWQRHQSLLDTRAADVFVRGDEEDLDQLVETLYEAEEPDSLAVGLQVTQVPKELKELCYELLDSGLPLMVWQRQQLNSTPRGHDWSIALPEKATLGKLPDAAKRERRSARRHPIESHYGHHLSLLWDDPHLIPPKSA